MSGPIDGEFIKWLLTLGVGGCLAALIFSFYRKDIKMYTELWKSTSEMLIEVVKDNTASNVKLIGLIESMERNSRRKEDVAVMLERAREPRP